MAVKNINSKWPLLRLTDVCEILDSKRIPVNAEERERRISGKPLENLYPYFGATGQVGYIDDYLLEGEYVLLGEDGAPFLDVYKNKAYIVDGKFWVNNHAHILLSKRSNKFLCYYLNYIDFRPYVTGTTRLKLTQNSLKQIPILDPPLPEQKKIVAKIEELFSRLDSGVAALKKAKEQLKLYRQAVLAAAFSGRLLKQESHEENEISALKAAEPQVTYGGPGEKPLPHGWKWVRFIDFCKLQRGYDLPLKKIIPGIYPVVTSGGIGGYHHEYKAIGPCLITGRSGSVGNIHFIDVEKYWPHNTVLYVKDFCNNIPKFIYYYFLKFNFLKFSSSTAVPTLDRKKLYNELIQQPPKNQQIKIVEEIESRFAGAEVLEKSIDDGLARAEALRQSILKQAFEGRLV